VLIRAASYGLPIELDSHVDYVFNTVHFPVQNQIKPISHAQLNDVEGRDVNTIHNNGGLYIEPGYVTPGLIKNYYNIFSLQGESVATQALYETIGQSMSPSDLQQFQNTMGVSVNPISSAIGGHVYDDACRILNNCGEANLDVQYIMGVAWGVTTVYNYWNGRDFMLDWITTTVNNPTPPSHVYSISYGGDERDFSTSYALQFNVEAIKLGVMGTTIFVSAGDDGALSSLLRSDPHFCIYSPSFPATSPYVVSVGATQGPEASPPKTERLCSTPNGAIITGGGGFSTIYAQPSWQSNVVNQYLANYGSNIHPGYNASGRGYPDVALLGHAYEVVARGKIHAFDGTSASSPVMASFVSLVNSYRLTHNQPTMGWINPLLYSNSSFAWDIQIGGKNNCSAGHAKEYNCCKQGFPTTPGWDAATGLGSVDFDVFFEMFAGPIPNSNSNSGLSAGAIAGIVIGTVLGVGLLAGIVFYFFFMNSKVPMASNAV
jgi:tripeptidyl-peptidase-1